MTPMQGRDPILDQHSAIVLTGPWSLWFDSIGWAAIGAAMLLIAR